MARKLKNNANTAYMAVETDDAGLSYVRYPNGKKLYCLTTAVTANTTLVPAGSAAGDLAQTSHATGLASIFRSDGTKWQYLTNA